jgi:hypothetical protein
MVRAKQAMDAAIQRLPHDLDRLEEETRKAVAEGPEDSVPRRKIAERILTPLGYEYVKARTSPGCLAFARTSTGGASFTCDFDFGSWRRSVVAIFSYHDLGCGIALPLRYSESGRATAIRGRQLFERTMENVAFVVREIEAVLT